MTTPEQTTTILNHSLHEFVSEIVDLTKEGWELDPDNLPATIGFSYEAHMWRNPTEEQRNALPKRSRAEILADARAAKAQKRAQAAEGGDAPY